MASATSPPGLDSCSRIIEEYLEVAGVEAGELSASYLVVRARRGSLKGSLEALYRELAGAGCYMRAARTRSGVILQVVRGGGRAMRLPLALGLAALTLATVYVSGLTFTRERDTLAWTPLGYLLGLLAPLLIHEAGHYIAMRRLGVPRSLPYLLPAPPLQLGFIGTFGAVINMRWLPPRSRHLALIGLMGPLAGFLAGIPVAYYGLAESVVRPAEGAVGLPLAPLIMLLLPLPAEPGPGETVILSPMAFSAYIVFFVTFLNLVPVAMLDGGHIVRSLLGERGHRLVSQLVLASLLAASLYLSGLLLFALIVFALYAASGGVHPGAAISEEGVDSPTFIVGVVYAVLLVLTLPVPV